MLPALAPPLQTILAVELATGNVVAETTIWPPCCELLVLLRHPFRQAYPLVAGLRYRSLNDPRYWLAEYYLDEGRQVLACRFS